MNQEELADAANLSQPQISEIEGAKTNIRLHVVQSLVKSVPNLGTPRATRIMLEAHNRGRAIVTTCPLELAELYRERLESFGLTATIESA